MAFAHHCDQKNYKALAALIKLYAMYGIDQAIRYQLLGDIAFAAGTLKEACSFYEQAAHFYSHVQHHEEAAALYEYLIALDPENKEYETALNQQCALIQKKLHPVQ